ncbi:RNA polymerase sigma factor [Flavimaricola sp.]|nr:RNA polymerase sigma factor [Flavimaricola sp.]MDA9020369.1 RNA polymerase sigma factor [Flavimaricola sp.]
MSTQKQGSRPVDTGPVDTGAVDAGPDDAGPDPDGALLVAFANGDPEAARLLTGRLTPKVLGQALRMLADRAEAEDVTQEAMVRLWRIAPDWRQGEARVSTWLYRVTANLCTDRLRRRRRTVSLDGLADPADAAATVADQMQGQARMAALSAALAALPERQAQAVALRHLEGLANPEIAEIMDISVEAVESLTARGKRALAAILAGRKAELGYEDE